MKFQEIHYPESKFGGFTKIDGTIAFYSRVNSLLAPDFTILDYGCGRGKYQDDLVSYRRNLRIFLGKVEKVIGVDASQTANENPYIDEFHLIENETWPLEDNSIDLCVCDWVIEHIKEPTIFFSEAQRVIKPGGYLCIRTSNLLGYAGIFSLIIPNGLHTKVLSKVQKERKEEDVFPTYTKCNTPRKMRAFLDKVNFDYVVYTHEAEPAYLNFSRLAYWLGVLYQRLAPSIVRRTIFAFAQVK